MSICAARPTTWVKVQDKVFEFTDTPYYQGTKVSLFTCGRIDVDYMPTKEADREEQTFPILRENGQKKVQRKAPLSDPLKFSEASLPWADFSQKYTSEGWFGRKVTLLFDLVISVVRLVIHVVRLLFVRIPAAVINGCEHIDVTTHEKKTLYVEMKMHVDAFSIVRDLEEIVGSIVMIFNDKVGCYLRQDSLFHKEIYAMRLEIHKA